MSGHLSQAVANLEVAEHQIEALSGLPPTAMQIQEESSTAILATISQITTMQKTVSSFVEIAIPELNDIETMVSGNKPLPQIKDAIANVQKEASTLKSCVDGISAQIEAVYRQVLGYFDQLAVIESDLTAQMTTLQGQLANAQSEEKATKNKYYYLIALGPFGLVGLAAALALYLKWQSDVNHYESQISYLNAQINSFNVMKSICQLLGNDFQGVVSKISGVTNSVDFLVSDILAINSDLDSEDSENVLLFIGIKINAAITEVTTLGVDAS